MSKKSKKKNKQYLPDDPAVVGFLEPANNGAQKMQNKEYEAELFKLQVELVKLQEWVKATKARVVIIFEGRDAQRASEGLVPIRRRRRAISRR